MHKVHKLVESSLDDGHGRLKLVVMLKRSICLAQGNRKLELYGGRDTCWGSTSDWRFTRTFYWVSIGPLHKAPEAVAMLWAARK